MKLHAIDGADGPLIEAERTIVGPTGFGFEGGCVLREGDGYHLFTAELVAEPLWSKTVLAHWESRDGRGWRRTASMFTSTGDFSGRDRRAAYFSPMPAFDDETDRWQLFYVSYRSAEGIADRNHDGLIWRAQSVQPGRAGIGGPYVDQDLVLRPGSQSHAWEGHQGTDSFFPFRVGGHWLGLYGSCDIEHYPTCRWAVGLAGAASLSGEWQRLPDGDALDVEPRFIENPVVTTVHDGTLVAVYENDALDPAFARSLGIMTSTDGLRWRREQPVTLPDDVCPWVTRIRTPLSFLPEGDLWRVYFTGFDDRGSTPGSASYGSVGMVRLGRAGDLSGGGADHD